jgi:hypothetical protein
MSSLEAVMLLARSQLWVREAGGENCGQVVEHYLSTVGQAAGEPWCAAFVSWVGRTAIIAWPVPMTASCQVLHDAAEKLSFLDPAPTPGAIFLLWKPALGRFAHTGFIVGRVATGWQTIEGNTNPAGGREGYGVFERTRVFAPDDRFIRWSH